MVAGQKRQDQTLNVSSVTKIYKLKPGVGRVGRKCEHHPDRNDKHGSTLRGYQTTHYDATHQNLPSSVEALATIVDDCRTSRSDLDSSWASTQTSPTIIKDYIIRIYLFGGQVG